MTFGSSQMQSHADCLRRDAKKRTYDPLVPISIIYRQMSSRSHDIFSQCKYKQKTAKSDVDFSWPKNDMSFFFQKLLHFFRKIYETRMTKTWKPVKNTQSSRRNASRRGGRHGARSVSRILIMRLFCRPRWVRRGGVRNVSKNENGKMKKRSFQILKSPDPWPACGRPRLGLCSHVSLPDFGGCWSTCKHKNMKNRKFENWNFESEISSRPALGRPPAGLGPVL